MGQEFPHHERRRPTHGVWTPRSAPTIVFVTACTKGRVPWLADPQVHELLLACWAAADAWLVGGYVLMPDHLHLFAAPADDEISLERWMRYWKSQFTKQHGVPEHCWQRSHWDRRLRSNENYAGKCRYVLDNPLRRGLVARRDDWPFAGTLNELTW